MLFVCLFILGVLRRSRLAGTTTVGTALTIVSNQLPYSAVILVGHMYENTLLVFAGTRASSSERGLLASFLTSVQRLIRTVSRATRLVLLAAFATSLTHQLTSVRSCYTCRSSLVICLGDRKCNVLAFHQVSELILHGRQSRMMYKYILTQAIGLDLQRDKAIACFVIEPLNASCLAGGGGCAGGCVCHLIYLRITRRL